MDARKYVNSSPMVTVFTVGCKVHNVFIENKPIVTHNYYVDNNRVGDPDTTTMQLRGASEKGSA